VIRINEISVSRNHATIRFEDGVFRLQDNNSKFGTLSGICEPLKLFEGNKIELQIKQAHLQISYERKEREGWYCCGPRLTLENEVNFNELDANNQIIVFETEASDVEQ